MTGRPRKPLAVQEAARDVHRSNADKAMRRAAEAAVECPFKDVEPPEYLETEKRRKRFCELAALLQATNESLCTKLDEDALARYVICEEQYTALSKKLDSIVRARGAELSELDKAQRMAKSALDSVRACAADMGLTVSSRLKLVDLRPVEKPSENPFARFEK